MSETRLPEAAAWLAAPDTRAVLEALRADGQVVRFVGGCVRNALLDRPVADIDIATPDPPGQVMALLNRAGIRAVPTGVAHGTVTAVSGGHPFEITTLRRDIRTFGRHAEVAFTDDWAADAQRRDFTMNALYADPDGAVYDPVGGLPDLEAQRVRFIGDPHARIREDYLRILRFFRVHAWYGAGPLDAAGLRAAAEEREGLRRLSAERVRDELLKLFGAADPLRALAAMRETGVLRIVLPEAGDLGPLQTLLAMPDIPGTSDPLLRLAALIGSEITPAEVATLSKRLRLSSAQTARLVRLAGADPAITSDMDSPAIRRAVYRVGQADFRDRTLLACARSWKAGTPAWRTVLETAESWTPPRFPLTGNDAKALGLEPGPEMGRALRAVEEWWIAQDFPPDRAALLKRLAQFGADV